MRAASSWMRGVTRPLRGSAMGMPVVFSTASSSATEAWGALDFRTAQAPATWGTAREVPSYSLKPPRGPRW